MSSRGSLGRFVSDAANSSRGRPWSCRRRHQVRRQRGSRLIAAHAERSPSLPPVRRWARTVGAGDSEASGDRLATQSSWDPILRSRSRKAEAAQSAAFRVSPFAGSTTRCFSAQPRAGAVCRSKRPFTCVRQRSAKRRGPTGRRAAARARVHAGPVTSGGAAPLMPLLTRPAWSRRCRRVVRDAYAAARRLRARLTKRDRTASSARAAALVCPCSSRSVRTLARGADLEHKTVRTSRACTRRATPSLTHTHSSARASSNRSGRRTSRPGEPHPPNPAARTQRGPHALR